MTVTGFYATIARYYDAEHFDKDEDLPFYDDVIAEHGDPVLIIGAGTGRVLMHIAHNGHKVHGIELEPNMLARAQAKLDRNPDLLENATLHQGDALTLPLEVKARTTIIPYNSLMHFHTQEKQLALLKRAREWTSEGGALVIDLPNAGDTFGSMDNSAVTLERTFLEPESGHLVMQQSVSELDRTEQLMYVTWIYDEVAGDGAVKRTVAPVVNRYFFYSELALLLNASGFNDLTVYGDFDYVPYMDGVPRMIVIAR